MDLQTVMMGRRLLYRVDARTPERAAEEDEEEEEPEGEEGRVADRYLSRAYYISARMLSASASVVQPRREVEATACFGDRGWREGPDPRRKQTRRRKTTIHRRQAAERSRHECSSCPSSASAAASRAATNEEGTKAKNRPPLTTLCVSQTEQGGGGMRALEGYWTEGTPSGCHNGARGRVARKETRPKRTLLGRGYFDFLDDH